MKRHRLCIYVAIWILAITVCGCDNKSESVNITPNLSGTSIDVLNDGKVSITARYLRLEASFGRHVTAGGRSYSAGGAQADNHKLYYYVTNIGNSPIHIQKIENTFYSEDWPKLDSIYKKENGIFHLQPHYSIMVSVPAGERYRTPDTVKIRVEYSDSFSVFTMTGLRSILYNLLFDDPNKRSSEEIALLLHYLRADLSARDPNDRLRAITYIPRIATEARSLLPALRLLLNDPHPKIREEAEITINIISKFESR